MRRPGTFERWCVAQTVVALALAGSAAAAVASPAENGPRQKPAGFAVATLAHVDLAYSRAARAYEISEAPSALSLRRVRVRTAASAAAVGRFLVRHALDDDSARRVLEVRKAGRRTAIALVLTTPRSLPAPTRRQLALLRRLVSSGRRDRGRELPIAPNRDRPADDAPSRRFGPDRDDEPTPAGAPAANTHVDSDDEQPEAAPPVTQPAPPPPPAPQPPQPDGAPGGELLFEDRFDSGAAGDSIWGPKQAAPGSLDYVDSPTFPGRSKAMRNRLEPGDIHSGTSSSRSELTGSQRFRDGDVRWFRMPVRFNEWSLQSGAWALIWQAHSGSGSPPLATYVQSDELLLRLKNGYTEQVFWEWEFELHRWYDIVIGTRFSHGSDGWVEVWIDGVQQKLRNGQSRMTGATLSPTSEFSYDKLGLYQSSSFSSGARELLHGMYRVGTTREAVVR